MTLAKWCAAAVVSAALFVTLADELTAQAVEQPTATSGSGGLYSFYKRSESGYLMLKTDNGWRVLSCGLSGWKTQTLYFRHNLDTLADGCHLTRE